MRTQIFSQLFKRDPVKEGMEAADRLYDTRQQLLENRLEQLRLIAKANNVIPFDVRRTKAHRP